MHFIDKKFFSFEMTSYVYIVKLAKDKSEPKFVPRNRITL